ncbi:tetratricopeptide repeat protein [Indioceanicola profundi]|uniref:tetratricopeptide repeat protein n=1 Tax=Indioceanicola profundi TaxID=2220096 RepID=UPI000E6AD344|nr:tetratricopeptide repeat protein [Indioceanicola profundi]
MRAVSMTGQARAITLDAHARAQARLRTTAAALGLLALAGAFWAGTAKAAPVEAPAIRIAEFSPVGSYLAGRVAQSAGDWDLAARHLSQALQADPGNTGLMRRAFLLHLGEGNKEEALRLARRIEGADGESYLASALLVADDLANNRADQALARLPALPSQGMGQFVTPLLTAWAQAGAGDYDAALAALAPLDQAAGFRPLKLLQEAVIQDLRGNAEEAGRLYMELARGDGQPLRLVQLTGNFLERQGRTEEARALYAAFAEGNGANPIAADALEALDKGRPPQPLIANAHEGLAEAMFELGSALHQEGAAEMALLYGRIALMLDGGLDLARLMVGDVLAARDRDAAALSEYKAVSGAPGIMWAARLRQADALRRLERTDEATKMLSDMAAERPERTDALIRLGDIARMDGRYEEAIAAYDRAVKRQEEAGRPEWLAYYLRGLSLDGAKRWPEAEKDLRAALELNPDHPSILNYLGYSYIDRGQNLEEARDLVARAVAKRPDDGHIVDSLGWAKFKLGDYHGAIEDLERAAELEPAEPTINDHLGDAYWAVGRKQEARFQWRRAAQQESADEALRSAAEQKLKHGLPLPKTAGLPEPQ